MRNISDISAEKILPDVNTILGLQGVPTKRASDEKLIRLADEALLILSQHSRPKGILSEISINEFAAVYAGEGLNESEDPLDPIYKKSDYLALFAVTLGGEICDKISSLFRENEFALASMLDCAASEATENAGSELETYYRRQLRDSHELNSSSATLRFSPGYCGWDISGQIKLFKTLRPEEIGIKLRVSLLMEPLKSISGVIVAGEKDFFEFEDNLAFCDECKTHTCRTRIKAIKSAEYD
jgi:hypothetical protein